MLICTLPERLKVASFCLVFPNMLNDKIIALPDLELKHNGVQAQGFCATLKPQSGGKSPGLNVCSNSCRLKFCLNLGLPNAEPFAASLGGAALNAGRGRAVLSTQNEGPASGILFPQPRALQGHNNAQRMWSVEK